MQSKPKILVIVAFSLFAFPKISRSQDTAKAECGDIITFKNESTQKAKIYEITLNEVVFKRCANLNGPIIKISKSNIKSITYLNGTKESFEKFVPVVEEYKPTPKARVADEPINLRNMKRTWIDTNYQQNKVFYTDRTKNYISTNIFNLIFFASPSLSYERILVKGKLGIRGVCALGFQGSGAEQETEFMTKHIKHSFGIDVNYYLQGGNFHPGPVKPFLGASFEYGVFTYTKKTSETLKLDSVFSGNPPTFQYVNRTYSYSYEQRNAYQFTYMFKVGLLCRPAKHFNISLVTGLGGMRFNNTYNHANRGIVKAEVNLGYKF